MITKIIIGSKSAIKSAAVRRACEQVGLDVPIETVAAESGVNNQPFGLSAGIMGADNRSSAAQTDELGVLALGIENCIFSPDQTNYYDVGVAVAKHQGLPNGQAIRVSERVFIPLWAVFETVYRLKLRAAMACRTGDTS